MITLPVGVPAGERRVAIQVRDVTDEAAIAIEDVTLDVPAQPRTSVKLEPTTVTAGKAAAFTVLVHNEGNTVQHGSVLASDPEAKTTYTFAPPTFSLSPGESTSVALEAKAKRPWVGDPLLRPFELRVDSTATPASRPTSPPAAAGVFVQKSRLSRGLLEPARAAVRAHAVRGDHHARAQLGRRPLGRGPQPRASRWPRPGRRPRRRAPARSAARVIDLSTGAPVRERQRRAVHGGRPVGPVRHHRDRRRRHVRDRPAAGGRRTRCAVTGAGLTEVWYAAAATQADATPITVTPGQTVSGLTVVVGGVPATIAGTVVGDRRRRGDADRRDAARHPRRWPATVPPEPGEAAPPIGSGAVVRTVPIGADGTFAGGRPAVARDLRPRRLQVRVRQHGAARRRRRRRGPHRRSSSRC